MGLESGTYIDSLNASNPVGASDPKSQGDDHIRLIKSTILNTFPNITGAVNANQTELNGLDGLTASRAIVTDGSGILSASAVTSTEVGYLDGVLRSIATPIHNYKSGCILSNDTDADHDINITAGDVADSTNTQWLHFSSEMTKQIDASWAAGDDAGGFPTGISLSINTWYHVFIIGKTDGTVDAGFDTSLTATNLLSDATGYTLYRRIGSVLTTNPANIVPFYQKGDVFIWETFVEDLDTTNGGISTTAHDLNLTVPTGVVVEAHFRAGTDSTNDNIFYHSPNVPDNASTVELGYRNAVQLQVLTDTSGNVREDSNANSGSTGYSVFTMGWREFWD